MEGNPPEMVALEKQLGQAKAKLRDAQNDEERTRRISELPAEKELNRSDLLRLERGLKVPEHHCIGIRKNLDDYMVYHAQSTSQIHNSNLACAISNLPDELLHSIFSYAIPPAFLLDPSIVRGPQSSWSRVLRLKKSLVQVCRVWYTVGMTFLYQDIVFRRVHQIPSFLRTIESSPALFGSMVKTIAFSAFVPEKFVISFSEQVQRIVGLSPHLTRILFDPVFPLPPIAAMPVMPRNVIHLAFGIQVQYISILPMLVHASESLHSLSLVFDIKVHHRLETPIHFPHLQTLHVKFPYDGIATTRTSLVANDIWLKLTKGWSLPQLRSLSYSAALQDLPPQQLTSFCLKHGAMLTSLRIVEFSETSNQTSSRFAAFQTILNACPTLKHLILDAYTSAPINHMLAHSCVEWVDLFSMGTLERVYRDLWVAALKRADAFPRLRGVRLISSDLRNLDVPSNMPPHEVVDMKDEYAYRTLGLNLRHDVGLVYAAPVPGPGRGYEIGCTGSTISAKVRDETEMMADEWESDVCSEVGEYRREYESYLDEREYIPSESESESEEMEEDDVSEAADSDEQVILNAISEGYN